MNKHAVLMVAAAIENATLASRDLGFNMARYATVNSSIKDRSGHACGTIACIAGWTVMLLDEDGLPRTSPLSTADLLRMADENDAIRHAAGQSLGLEKNQSFELFMGVSARTDLISEISPAYAAAVLRHLAKTGDVNWLAGPPVEEMSSRV